MHKYKWSYCLNDEQLNKLLRIIKKVPGMIQFLDTHEESDLGSLITDFTMELSISGLSTPGVRMNLSLIEDKYNLFKKEYDESRRDNSHFGDFDPYSVLTWTPKPKWAEKMSIEEIDYLDHFIPLVIGLPQFLFKNKDSRNLYDLVNDYQSKLNAIGKNNPDVDFVLETIKERFYRIMDDHTEAIHYVNHSQQIDDHLLLQEFDTEAKDRFYITNLEDDVCGDFTNKYIKESNPYVAAEIFQRFFKANKVNIALSFAQRAFTHIFSAPNIYWHNKEAIYGSVNILNMIVDALGHDGMLALKSKNEKLERIVIESLYLVLSRTIYWTDYETYKYEKYVDNLFPINVQHKLRAYWLRSSLIQAFGDLLSMNHPHINTQMMALSDLMIAHTVAYSHRILGKDSVFHRDAVRIFHEGGLFKFGEIDHVSEEGAKMNDNLAEAIHAQYKIGTYSLTDKEISELTIFLRQYLRNQHKIALEHEMPIPYLIKDNFSPAYKSNKEEIRQYLIDNGIEYFYHFTEPDRLKSIIKYGGLLSSKRCLDDGIVMPVRDDMALSRDLDARYGLEDYARLSFSNHLPKLDERKREGAHLVMLKISIDVALFEDTMFTDMEATHEGFNYGPSIDDLKRVDMNAVMKEYCDPASPDYLKSQAEILVKGCIPLKYITNIKNPEILD